MKGNKCKTDADKIFKKAADLIKGDKTQDFLHFENLAVNCFTLTSLHSADKFSKRQQILGILKGYGSSSSQKARRKFRKVREIFEHRGEKSVRANR